MKNNLRLNTTLSLKALEAQAIKATAIQAARQTLPPTPHTPKINKPKPAVSGSHARCQPANGIEREVKAIFSLLRADAAQKKHYIAIDQTGEGLSTRWLISVFNSDDFSRQMEEDKTYREYLRNGSDRRLLAKPYKATPIEKYGFYPDPVWPDRLGSVAIYGKHAALRKNIIERIGYLFGHKVAKVSLVMGRRLFVDVRFAVFNKFNEV